MDTHARPLHVGPLPADHAADPDCPCRPIPSVSFGGARILVHRTERHEQVLEGPNR